KKGDTIDGVIAYFIRNGVMTTPILGYDTTSDQQQGLYRILTFLITTDSMCCFAPRFRLNPPAPALR
ncbi:hypothetical protein ACT453_43635, partial [Bacillus sp. D-CC]